MVKRARATAAETMARLEADPEFQAQKRLRENEVARRLERIRSDQEPILADLREVGLNINSVWDLVNTREPYPEAIPILLRHLQVPYSDVVKDGIARSLAVPIPEVRSAWPMLVEEYQKAPIGFGLKAPGDTMEAQLGAKYGLACALSASVSDELLPELIELARNRSHGDSRLLLLPALKKRRKKQALVRDVLQELKEDPALAKEITSWDRRS